MNISVVGQGKLGACMSAICADAGHKVTGIDSNVEVVQKLSSGKCHIVEPNLPELLARQNGRLKFSNTMESCKSADLIFIIVPTPSMESGRFTNDYIISAIHAMGKELAARQSYFVLVVTSTIMPGSMRQSIVPEAERVIGRRVGDTWGACYCPEFIALGNVIQGMTKPDAILIGESDAESGRRLANFQQSVVENTPTIVRTSWENAEIAKIGLNSYITMKISFANMIAQVCDQFDGGNVDEVIRFLGLDTRVNPKYLKAGTSYGGTCFPRDCKAMATCTSFDNSVPLAIHEFNNHHVTYIADSIDKLVYERSVISILGIAFKPNTPVTECSASLAIGAELERRGHTVKYYDPEVCKTPDSPFFAVVSNKGYCKTIEQCLTNSQMAVLATPWEQFKEIKPSTFYRYMATPRIYDCWRFYGQDYFKDSGVEYNALGIA